MGMGTVSSHLIMFIAVISISTLVVAVFNDQMETTTSSVVSQQNWLSQQLKTDITIEVIDFANGTENQTTVYLENTGATIIDLTYTDIYIGGERIDRDESSRTIEVLSDTDSKNTGLWDPKEQLKVVVNKTLEENATLELVVTTQFGGKTKDDFST
jgi:archaellum component FlaG (FlaF/FlaG flagellin family)